MALTSSVTKSESLTPCKEYLVTPETRKDFDWQLRYELTVRQKVGPFLLEPASWERDTKEATDFVRYRVIGEGVSAVAARIRRPEVMFSPKWAFWQWQFTVRLWRKNGVRTEHAKLVDGYADWLFYAVAAPDDEIDFAHWMLVNLRPWRSALATPDVCRALQIEDRDNTDGTTGFRSYDIRSFPLIPSILIASSFQWPLHKAEVQLGLGLENTTAAHLERKWTAIP